jgi:hypothetical protein
VRAEPRRGPCSVRCPRRARCTRGSRPWRAARRPRLARPCPARSPTPAPVRRVARGHGARRPGARPRPLSAACPRSAAPCARPRLRPGPGVSSRPCAAWPRPSAASDRAVVVPLRSAARAQLGPSVCATRSRRVSAALRARARVVRVVLWHGSPCPRRARLPPRRTCLPPCNPCVVIALFLLINGNSIWKLVTLVISCS